MRLVKGGLLLLAASLSQAAFAQAVPITLAPGEILLQVQAEGVYSARPDMMTIDAGVVTTGASAGEALNRNSVLAQKLIDAVRASGVEPRDIRTARLAVNPQFDESDRDRADREEREPRITGYVARNELELRLRDLTKAPELIDRLFAAGANQVSGPKFALTDPAPAKREARRAAVASARTEAEEYAAALGMRISRVLRVSERGQFETDRDDYIVVTGSRMRATPVEPGEIDTEATVWIDYALTDRDS